MAPRISTTVKSIAAECVAMRSRRVARIVSRIFDDALRPHGMTAGQLNLMVGIVLSGEVRPGDLARTFDMEKSTISRNLQRLAEQKWIRIAEGDDARSQIVTITDRGERAVQDAYPAWRAAQKEAKAAVGDTLVEAFVSSK